MNPLNSTSSSSRLPRSVLFAVTALALPVVARDPDECEDVAKAIKNANENEAQADYWLQIANCRNGRECDERKCEREAKAGLKDALALAKEQYRARLDICDELGGGAYDPELDPRKFSTTIDNVYFPFPPGVTLVYEGSTADGLEHDEVTALDTTDDLGGFLARQVHDVVTVGGVLIEDTTDWYAQSPSGDVWYIGEISRNYEDGFLDNLDGSWRTGKDDAKPGIVMLASPKAGAFYRQEFLVNEAEDVARVLAIDETVTIGLGSFPHCIKTEETSAMEPGVAEWKYYAPGIGLVLIVDLDTGDRVELVDVR